MDDTRIQFDSAPNATGERTVPVEAERRGATVCPQCAQHFSPDGRFCPFDGEPLLPAPDWDPHADPLLGVVVDNRYEIESVLGEGGMGVVYAARHRALGKRFALKALRKDLATEPEIAARFTQEARTAASVSHPGLVEITDFGRLPSGQPFFVMELLEGQSLAQLIRRGGPIPAARAVDIIRQIADAMAAAHERSIVHRDLKPENIHIAPDSADHDCVTIVDFGLAKVIGANRLTRAGMVFGTPHYMSPEQAQGDATDHRADIYALGIVMYEMFTGRVPFEADSYMGVLTKHMYMAPTPPSQLVGTDKLGVLEDITLRCLEKKPDLRYQTLRELMRDLDLAMHPTGERPSTATRQRRVTPRSLLADELELPSREERAAQLDAALPKPWPWGLITVIGGLFLVGIAGMFAFRAFAIPQAEEVPSLGHASVTSASAAADIVSTRNEAAQEGTAHAAVPVTASSLGATAADAPAPASAAPRAALQASAKPAVRVAAPATAAVLRPVSTPKAEKKPIRPGASEIVDPWGR